MSDPDVVQGLEPPPPPNDCATPLILKLLPLDMLISPLTSNLYWGVLVFIPTLPELIILNLSVPPVVILKVSVCGNPKNVSVSPVCVI